ncbi:hypothetical protein [Paenibacillus sp. L3-i20]|uniref:hypothetical protein n=1 Tax=Paenibacillus sp. L3-i20 TaxID=2905833 RepID=UPI001EDEA11C|nr:hypothetical protein [Paenibacillus sp. L3-i20]GKU76114.1 hypothetical protein L3i20_v205110 [Paenibacillus sp. L3-i20]
MKKNYRQKSNRRFDLIRKIFAKDSSSLSVENYTMTGSINNRGTNVLDKDVIAFYYFLSV